MRPTTVAPVSGGAVLDQNFADNRVEAMRAMGAKNVDPPLARSPFLKNINTGLVLPWSDGLAEQRDIMVNCDAFGNTDPAYWASAVNPEAYSKGEHDELMRQALGAIHGYQQHEAISPGVEMNQPAVFPEGAKPMDEYFAEANAAALDNMENLLE